MKQDVCSDCKDSFDPGLCQQMCVNGKYKFVCGVCALSIMRKLHGMPNYMFAGENAKRIYDECLAAKKAKVK